MLRKLFKLRDCILFLFLLSYSSINAQICATSSLPSNLQVGLVGFYPFCGNANDVSGNNIHGTATGAQLIVDRFGVSNSAYSLNGINQYITIPDNTINDFTNEFSIGIWVRPAPGFTGGQIIGKWGIGGVNNAAYSIAILNNGNILGYVHSAGTNEAANTSPFSLVANNWYHIVYTFKNRVLKIYIDGVLRATRNTVILSQPSQYNIDIGREAYGANQCGCPYAQFKGAVDDAILYNRELSSCEVQQLFQYSGLNADAGVLSGNQSIAIGETTTFSSTITGGSWSASNTSVAQVDASSGLITGVAAGSTTITYTKVDPGCSPLTSVRIVTVTCPTSAGTLSGTQSLCVGSSATYTSTVSGGTWTTTNASVANVSPSGLVTGVAAGTATITYTVAGSGGCAPASATRLVTVTAPPASGTISGSNVVCAGSSTTLTSTISGGTWTTSTLSVATVNAAGVVTGVTAGAATITYSVTGTGGCSNAITTHIITVSAPPNAGSITGTTSLCVGATATLSASVSGGTWTTTDANKVSISSTGSIIGVTPGTATISYTVAGSGGCANATTSIAVTVTAPPSAGTLAGSQEICLTENWILESTTTRNMTSGWSLTLPTNDPSSVYKIEVSGRWGIANGRLHRDAAYDCGSNNTIGVTGTPLPNRGCDANWSLNGSCPPPVPNSPSGYSVINTYTYILGAGTTAGTTIAFSDGNYGDNSGSLTFKLYRSASSTTTFSSSVSGGTWSSSTVSVATIHPTTGVITAISAGSATMTYTVAGTGGCANATAIRVVTVGVPPSAGTLTGSTQICIGATTTLSSTVAGGTWTNNNLAVSSIDPQNVVTGLAAGSSVYTYTVLGTTGCPNAAATITVSVSAPPVAGNLSGVQAICANGSTTFSSSVNGGTWNSSNTAVAVIGSTSGVVSGLSAGTTTMTYTVTGSGGCTNAVATRTLTVTAVPSAGTLSGTQNICVGGITTLTSTVSGGTWSSGNTALASIDPSSGAVVGIAPGLVVMTYTIIGTGGCANATATRAITVTAPPSAGTLSGSQAICVGGTSVFTSTVSGGSWASAASLFASINSSTGAILGIQAGLVTMTYTVVGTGGCANAIGTRGITITAPPSTGTLSGSQNICVAGSTTFTSTISGGTWSSGNTAIAVVDPSSGLVAGIASGNASIIYTVAGTGGCANVTANRSVTVTAPPNAGTLTGSQNICEGGTTTFSSSISGGVWASLNQTIATVNSSTGVVTGIDAGSTTITYTVNGTLGCPNVTVERVVVVTAPVNPGTLTGTQAICIAGTSLFTSSVTGGTWSSANPLIATVNSNSGIITGVSAGTASITYTVAGLGGCANSTVSRSIVVSAPSSPGVLSGSQAICESASVTFSSTVSGGTWASANSAIATVNFLTGVVTGVSGGNTTISYTVPGVGGCSAVSSNRIVTVTPLPSAGTLSGTNNVCIGGIANFTSSVGGGSWSVSDPSVATVTTSGNVLGVSAGFTVLTYRVSGTGGCADATVIRTITVTAPPQAGSLSGSQAICVGGATTFNSTVSGGSWSSANTAVATVNTSSGAILGIGAGTTAISYTIPGTGGCANVVVQRNVTVTAPSNPGTLSGLSGICVGSNSLFSSTVTGGTWSSNTPAIAIVATTGLVTGVAPGTAVLTYTVAGTGGCASSTTSTVVTVTAPPQAGVISGTQLICIGSTTSFSASTNGGSWASSNPLVATVGVNGLVTGIAAGTVSIVYTIPGAGGCSNVSVSRSVSVSAPPSAGTLSATSSICVGASVSFTSSVTGGIWTSSNPAIAQANASSGLVVGVAPGSAVVTYTVAGIGGCADATAIQAVVVQPLPVVEYTINAATQCLLANQFLFSNQSTITSGVLSYVWSFGDNSPISTVASPVHSYSTPGNYNVTLVATSAAGCRATLTRPVTIVSMPSGVLNPVTSDLLCEGGAVNLTATGGATYQWLLNGGAIPGAVNATLSATQPGIYTVNVINNFGCSTLAVGSVSLRLVRKPIANFSFSNTCAGFQTRFLNLSDISSDDIASYNWSFGQGQGVSTQQNPQYTFTSAGSYNVSLSVTSQLCPAFVSTITKPIAISAPPANQRYTPVNAVENRSTDLFARSYGGALYNWSPSTGLNSTQVFNPIFNHNAQVEYIITITTPLGCVLKDTQLVRVFKAQEIYVPKGFSPNGDSKNDRLIPRLVGISQLIYFKIYNRWGQLIFSTNTKGDGWDGKYRGAKQPMDTYVWMAEARADDGKIIKRTGNFILLH
jgi:gliding motility-associated-like protein